MMSLAGNKRGFTLIELLIVIAIIGVLAAIAIPSFLGLREKAREKAMIGSARGAVVEIRAMADDFNGGKAFLSLDSSANMTCFESPAVDAQNKCSSTYSDVGNVSAYDKENIDELVSIIIDNHKGKNTTSPYGISANLFVGFHGTVGTIAISSVGTRYIKVSAYGLNTSVPLYRRIL